MTLRQKVFLFLEEEIHAGSVDYVSPTVCLLPACASANSPAHVEPAGKAVTNKLDDMGTVRLVAVNGLILFLELMA
ncbi:MAG: hypothetical protein ACYC6R_02745 [Anaerolineales bacterium]